jgi:drug/metabolite transporter (DMT)-like permease
MALSEVPIFTFRAICLGIAGPTLLAVAWWRGERLAVPRRERLPLLAVAFFNIAFWYVCASFGLVLMEAGRAAIVAYTMPVWAALLAWPVLGERPSRTSLAALALGVAALALLLAPAFRGVAASPAGALVMLVGSLGWAIGTVLLKRFRFTQSVLKLSAWQLTLSALPMIFFSLALEDPSVALLRLRPEIWALTLYVAVVAVTLGQVAWFKVVDLLPATVASLASLVVPVVGVLSSAWFLGEEVRLSDLAALVLVLVALVLVLRR